MLRTILVGVLLLAFAYSLGTYKYSLTDAEFKERYGPWAVVAGASQGLGAAWADELASKGLNVMLLARREKEVNALAEKIAKKHKVQTKAKVVDLSDVPAVDEVLGDREVGLLVFNAAYDCKGWFLNSSEDLLVKAHNVNMRAPLLYSNGVAKRLAQAGRPGGIVLMSSMAGTVGASFVANYAATKAWNTAFAQGLWYELKRSNIDVVGCTAGATTTPNYLDAATDNRPTFIEQTAEEVVVECAAALGQTPSTPTGPLNKFVEVLFKRLLPLKLAVSIFGDSVENQMKTS